jgi:hypothetical protein
MPQTTTDRGRSPAEIDAEISRLQEGIRRAASAVDAAAPDGTGEERAGYHAAVAEVSRATRALVDFEARIPDLAARHRIRLAVRIARRACGGLLAVSAGVCAAAAAGAVSLWWLGLAAPLLVGALTTLPLLPVRATDARFRPRTGAVSFGVAAVALVLGCTQVVSAWLSSLSLVAAGVGLAAFRVLRRRELRRDNTGYNTGYNNGYNTGSSNGSRTGPNTTSSTASTGTPERGR